VQVSATNEKNRFIRYSTDEIAEAEGGKSYSMTRLSTPL
jgi:hypothetical protein